MLRSFARALALLALISLTTCSGDHTPTGLSGPDNTLFMIPQPLGPPNATYKPGLSPGGSTGHGGQPKSAAPGQCQCASDCTTCKRCNDTPGSHACGDACETASNNCSVAPHCACDG